MQTDTLHHIYLYTLDSHDCYGPFFPTASHSSYWWAHIFASHRKFGSYELLKNKPYEATVLLPITCSII